MDLNKVKMNALWADYRVTDYQEIERWWEIIFSAYLMVSLQSSAFKNLKEQDDTSSQPNYKTNKQLNKFSEHILGGRVTKLVGLVF